MSEPKIVESVGTGTVRLGEALRALQPKDGSVRAEIAKVRVQKVRDGKVYETVELDGVNR